MPEIADIVSDLRKLAYSKIWTQSDFLNHRICTRHWQT